MPRDYRLSSPPAVDPGREQPPCFAQAPVPDPGRGLLTPRLSPPLSAPRSQARSRSPNALNRRSERRSDRSLIARSIHSLDEPDADVWISAFDIRGEQEGEHRGEHPLRARCSPFRSPGIVRIAVDANGARRATASANFNHRCELLNARIGRRPVPPVKFSAVSGAVNRSTVA